MRPIVVLASFGFAIGLVAHAHAGNSQYDFSQSLSQPYPLPGAAPAPAPRSLIAPLLDGKFTGKLYDMNAIDGSRGLNRAVARPAPATIAPRPTSARSDFNGALYDMRELMGREHPFAGGRLAPVPIAMPAGGGTAPAPASAVAATPMTPAAQTGNRPPLPDDIGAEEIGLGPQTEVDVNDPLEPLNRFFFGFNEAMLELFIGPVARTYNTVVPLAIRTGIKNFLENLDAPVTLANDLLQFEFTRAGTTAARIAINTTVGVVGIIDVAEKWGFKKHREDFGQTLAVWGLGEPFYLVLPIFGPSNPRDAIGKFVVDGYLDPVTWYLDHEDFEEASYARTGVSGLVTFADLVDEIDELRASSVDFYGAMRSLYRQKRASDIANGVLEGNIPEFEIPPPPHSPRGP